MRIVVRTLIAMLVGLALGVGPACAASSPSSGWHLTTYYTAVASLHHGAPTPVTGCLVRDCANGHDALGTYPADFVQAVEDEGTGRIDVGPNAGKYLEWSEGIGFWLDTVPLDSYGRRLVPFVSAAADRRVLPKGALFRIVGCGRQGRDPLEPQVCAKVRAARWEVRDEFTTGLGGRKHVDLYLGEEQGADFTDVSPFYFDATRASLQTP